MSGDFVLYKYGAALCHDLALDNTGNYRVAGEMAACKELVLLRR